MQFSGVGLFKSSSLMAACLLDPKCLFIDFLHTSFSLMRQRFGYRQLHYARKTLRPLLCIYNLSMSSTAAAASLLHISVSTWCIQAPVQISRSATFWQHPIHKQCALEGKDLWHKNTFQVMSVKHGLCEKLYWLCKPISSIWCAWNALWTQEKKTFTCLCYWLQSVL